jgi:hypothetical protein
MEASIKGAKVVKVLRGRSELPRRLDKASLLMEAIWGFDTPHKVGILRRSFDLFAGRSGRSTRKKSPTENRGRDEGRLSREVA